MIGATYGIWYIGMGLSFLAIVAVVIIVSVILTMASRIADQAAGALQGVDAVRAQTTALATGVDMVNDSGVRIMHMVRSLRKVLVGE
jgi:hypothetical protein